MIAVDGAPILVDVLPGNAVFFPTYGMRVPGVWVHNWAFADERVVDWFCQSVLCRVEPGGWVKFLGWDGSVMEGRAR